MNDQHGTGILQVQNYDELRFLMLTQYSEGSHDHYYGLPGMVPLTEEQARQARRDGVGIDLPVTALLAQRDGE